MPSADMSEAMLSLREARTPFRPCSAAQRQSAFTTSGLSQPPLSTDLPLRSKEVRPAVTLRHAIEEWLDEHGLTFEQVGAWEGALLRMLCTGRKHVQLGYLPPRRRASLCHACRIPHSHATAERDLS